jgi:hypothetical protein
MNMTEEQLDARADFLTDLSSEISLAARHLIVDRVKDLDGTGPEKVGMSIMVACDIFAAMLLASVKPESGKPSQRAALMTVKAIEATEIMETLHALALLVTKDRQ